MPQSYQFYIPLFLIFCVCACLLSSSTGKKIESKPNVIMIAVDDLNGYLSVFDDPNAITPNFERLAEKGIWFSNAHCQAPLCGPSRASIMTGLRPSTTGIYGMINDNLIIEDQPVTANITFLPKYFQDNGYETYGVGKIFHRFAPKGVFQHAAGRFAKNEPNHGFGVRPENRLAWQGDPPEAYAHYGRTSTDWGPYPAHDSLMTDSENVDWFINQLSKFDAPAPFFMTLGLLRPHVPWHVPQKWFELYDPEHLVLPPYLSSDFDDIPQIAQNEISFLPMMPTTEWAIQSRMWPYILQAYLACVSYVDDQIGKVLDVLEDQNLLENTIIILWSDHGYRIGEKGTFAKHALWREATNAPLFIAAPGLPQGMKYEHPVEMLDIYPTLIELCGLEVNSRNEGKSLVSRMLQPEKGQNDCAITTYGKDNHAVRTRDWTYIEYEDGSTELYQKSADPNEFSNLAVHQKYATTIDSLQTLLPSINNPWHPHSSYRANPYFIKQKEKSH